MTKNTRLLGPILALLMILFASQSRAQINPDLVKQALSYDHWLAFEPEAAIDQGVEALKKNPSDPTVSFMLQKLNWAESSVTYTHQRKIGEALLALCEKGNKLSVFGANAREFSMRAANWASQTGDYATAHAIYAKNRGIQDWAVIGPFASDQEGDQHYTTLAPELLVSYGREMAGEYGNLRWETWKHDGPFDDNVSLDDFTRRRGNGFFMWCEIENLEEARDVVIDFGANSGGVRAWLDGQMVFNRRPYADESRDDIARVNLSKGKHSLVVKLGTSSETRVAIVDALTRLPLAGIASAAPSAASASFKPQGDLPAAAFPYRTHILPYRQWLDANASHALAPEVQVMLAFQYLAEQGESELAEDYWHATEEWRAGLGARARVFDYFYYESWSSLATAGERARKRREALTWLMENVDGEVMATLKMAELHGSEGRERVAADTFEKLLERKNHWAVRIAYSNFLAGKSWRADARDQELRAYEGLAASKAELPLAAYSFQFREALSSQDMGLANSLALTISNIVGKDHNLAKSYRSNLRQTKDLKEPGVEAAARAELADDLRALGYASDGYYGRLAELEEALGNLPAAEAALIQATKGGFHWEYRNLKDLAQFYVRHGMHDKGLVAFKRYQELEPGDRETNQYLDHFDGTSALQRSEWNSEVGHEMLDLLKTEDFPKASAGYLLDEEVWEIAADGSKRTFEQKVIKILRQDGVDRFGRQRPNGQVTLVRTMLGKGGESEPATVVGNSFEFPLVAPGNALHWISRDRRNASAHRVFEGVNFYFAERDLGIPTAVSRLVIVIGQDTPLRYRENNMKGVTFEEQRDSQGRRVLIWEMRSPRSVENEAFMPSREEILPYLEFVRDEITEDDAIRAVRARAEIVRPTWLVRETAETIRANVDGVQRFDESEAGYKSRALAYTRACYDWVNQTIKVEGGPDEPHLVIQQKAGDRRGLFRALLVALDIPFNDIYVADRAAGVRTARFFEGQARFSQHLFEVHGTFIELWNRQAPFGECDDVLAGARAVRLFQGGEKLEPFVLPSSIATRMVDRSSYAFELNEDLSAKVTGEVREFERGWGTREEDRESSEIERRRTLIGNLTGDLAGIEVASFKTSDLEELGTPYVRSFEGSLSGVAAREGEGGLKIAPHLSNTAALYSAAIETETRVFDLILGGDSKEEIELRYRIPDGYALDSLPEDVALFAAPFTYWLTYRLEGDWIVIERHFEFTQRRIAAAEYQSFKAQIKAIGDAERRNLTFTKIGS